MSKKVPFIAACDRGDLAGMIASARPIARWMITDGGGIGADPHDRINILTGGAFEWPRTDKDDVESWTSYCHHVNAALALGIAIGQLVSADVFTKDGAQ